MTEESAQRIDSWYQDRLGKVTASRIKDIAKRQKNGSFYATRDTYKNQIISEILTGVNFRIPASEAMQHGTDTEPQAIAAYKELVWDDVIASPAFVVHPEIDRSGASPDGLVGTDGIIEIKCPNTTTHVMTLRENSMPEDHKYQIQWQLACTGRKYCDFMSFDPRLPEKYQIFIERVERDPVLIGELETIVRQFLAEIDDEIKVLQEASFTHIGETK